MFKALIALVVLSTTSVASAGLDSSQLDADACDTNYGEVLSLPVGPVAYCVPDDAAEACLEVTERLDCSELSPEACDYAMGEMFHACVTLSYLTGAVR